MDGEALSNQCVELCSTLRTENEKDIDGKELGLEINNLLTDDMTALEFLLYP